LKDTIQPARIVVIDDSATDVCLLRHALDQHHEPFELKVLKDGEEALQFVYLHRRASQEPEPCVIVLDLHLPRYDGMAVLRAIKQEPVLAHISVVILTTLATPEEEREMVRMGVRLYQGKPMDLDELTAVAGRILDICKEAAPIA
jgi:CheY-like chemotaxis protein